MKIKLYGYNCCCCKQHCKICMTYTIDEVDSLIDGAVNTLAFNFDGFVRKEFYDYESCFSDLTHKIGEVYLSFLLDYRDSIIGEYRFKIEKCDLQQTIENIKNYISDCPGITPTLVESKENLQEWLDSNKDFDGFKRWEQEAKKELGVLAFDEIFSQIKCELVYDFKAVYKNCDILYDILEFIQNKQIKVEAQDSINIKEDCIVTYNDSYKISECIVKHQELLKQYNCNLRLDDYLQLISCGLTYDFIMMIYDCGLKLTENLQTGCPDLIINDHAYSMCDLSFSETSKTKLIQNLKEITLL